jgi:hypothetical protein
VVLLIGVALVGAAAITAVVVDGARKTSGRSGRASEHPALSDRSFVSRRLPRTVETVRCWCGNNLATTTRHARIYGMTRHWCERCGRWNETEGNNAK